jgi:hypothetical protein
MLDFPPLPIATAIGIGVVLLPFYAVLGRIGRFVTPAGRRLYVVFAMGALAWLALLPVRNDVASAKLIVDVASGFLILLGAFVCAYLVVSLFAWGFTMAMIRDLERLGGSASLESWRDAVNDGQGITSFADNRLQLLVAARVARFSGETISLTPYGRLIARLTRFLMVYFGVARMRSLGAGKSEQSDERRH